MYEIKKISTMSMKITLAQVSAKKKQIKEPKKLSE